MSSVENVYVGKPAIGKYNARNKMETKRARKF